MDGAQLLQLSTSSSPHTKSANERSIGENIVYSHESGDLTSSETQNGQPHELQYEYYNHNAHAPPTIDCGDSGEDSQPKPKYGKKTRGRVKIKMQFINNKLRRYTTFSKRKTGIMKKAYELSTLTGTQVMLLVASETGHVYTFATKKLQPMITSESGKALIQTCLNSPESAVITQHDLENDRRMNPNGFEETELCYAVGDEEDGEGGRELTESMLSGNGMSDNHEQVHDGSPGMLQQTSMSHSHSTHTISGNTFNINTIIPPTSNSDGTMGKVTNISMQVPQAQPVQNNSISIHQQQQQQQQHVMFTSSGGQHTNRQVNTQEQQQRLSEYSSSSNDRQLQRQKEEQQHEIDRLTQLNHEQQQQLQLQQLQQIQLQQPHIVQQLATQANSQQQMIIPKSFLTAVGGGTGGQVLYQTPQNPTLVYAAAPGTSIPNPLADGGGGMALVNIVTSQPNSYATSHMQSITTPAQPQFITIPVSLSQLANNPMLQQAIAGQQDLSKKT